MNTWWPSAVSWNSFASSLANHLWQTTLCVIAAAVLVRLVGARHPRVRHAIWLTASVKFLVPFSALVAAGRALAPETPPVLVMPAAIPSFEIISRPFVVWAEVPADAPSGLLGLLTPVLAAIWLVGGVVACGVRWTRWRRMASTALDAPVLLAGREADAVRRVIARLGFRRPLAIHESAVTCGPGLFGIHRARLLWPAGLSRHLGDEEIDSIVAHEISHLRRADNLTSLVHTVVETLFWFHPVVWWLGARLVHEREQACDQDVLSLGVRPETYAESLLKVCRFSLRSPQTFVAGMTGSDLSQRVEAIMTYRSRSSLSVGRRVLVAVVAALIVAGPVAAGAIVPPNQTMSASVVPGLVELVSPFTEPAPIQEGAVPTPRPQSPSPAPAPQRSSEPAPTPDANPALRRLLPLMAASPGAATPQASTIDEAITRALADRARLVEARALQDVAQTAEQIELEFRRGAISPFTTGLIPAKTLKSMQPTYTASAMRAKIQGSVEVEVVVGSEGAVERARVVRSLDREHGLDEQALAAARQWRFEPATLNGDPVAIWMRMTMDFRLY